MRLPNYERLLAKRAQHDDGEAAFAALMSQLPEYLVYAIHDALTGEPMLTQTPVWGEDY